MRFDFTDLRLFLAVADAGSITHGAADVGLSLAAASDRLREMEATGQVRLLERGRRGVTLTEAGEALSHHAREILHQAALMRGELGRYAKGIRASIRVVANTAAIVEVLPTRLSPWLAAHPQVDVDLRERQSHEIARSIAAGFADIGILSDAAVNEELLLKPFAVSKLVVVSAQTHSLAAEKEVRFSDLTEEYFVGLEGGALQDHIDVQADRLGVKLRYRIRLRTFESICSAASDGVGVAIVPETVARRCKRTFPISITPVKDAWARRQLSVCVAASLDLTPTARDLFDHLTSV
ncbi:molybdate transport repressor ModE-like protein [Mycoplana sp. BE70]|uniref:LysR family transcriptional regulator n=1 Tax=Mycoplana sp. BE70 TaxID=2817775 RepID=UPI00286427DD|nr:LysR family transcriptional regulator [Mycoplana sp. BE70]MDR6759428.1 molybdate transport repressor ModE-like protein [Mycoplana sp. BE70]